MARQPVETEFVDARVAANVTSRIRPNTRLIYVETPSNPLLHVVDIAAIAKALKPGIELFVDATFGSPALQSPIELGATLSLHSATTFLAGHSTAGRRRPRPHSDRDEPGWRGDDRRFDPYAERVTARGGFDGVNVGSRGVAVSAATC